MSRGNAVAGVFITLEGIDGCGKSTQADRLVAWLEAETGRGVLRTFEPGGWGIGQSLRSLILHGDIRDPMTELLLFLADRNGHLAEVIRPALDEGRIVLCERYSDSTLAYQAGGRGLDAALLDRLMGACDFPEPDLTVFLEISADDAAERLISRGRADRIEAGGLAFMERVAAAYGKLARSVGDRALIVPASGPEDEVERRIRLGIRERLGVLF